MKILLVDDEVHSRDAMRWFLKRQQHEVVEFSNGKDALKNYVPEEYIPWSYRTFKCRI